MQNQAGNGYCVYANREIGNQSDGDIRSTKREIRWSEWLRERSELIPDFCVWIFEVRLFSRSCFWQHEFCGPLVRQTHHKLSDVPGYPFDRLRNRADKPQGEDRNILKLRPGNAEVPGRGGAAGFGQEPHQIQRRGDLPRQGPPEPLLLQPLLLLDRYQDDLRHSAWKEDRICGGRDMRGIRKGIQRVNNPLNVKIFLEITFYVGKKL